MIFYVVHSVELTQNNEKKTPEYIILPQLNRETLFIPL